jgi:hypothetical protein
LSLVTMRSIKERLIALTEPRGHCVLAESPGHPEDVRKRFSSPRPPSDRPEASFRDGVAEQVGWNSF